MADKVIDINRKRKGVRTNTGAQGDRHNKGQLARTGNHAAVGKTAHSGKNAAASSKAANSANATDEEQQDYSLYFIIFMLLGFGLVMLYSTSSYEAAIDFNGDSAHYLKRQLFASVLGIIAMFVVARLPYRIWKRLADLLYIVSLVLVALVAVIGTEVNGAKRWIYVGPISVQPAEISKIAVIVMTAYLICQLTDSQLRTWKGFCIVVAPCVIQGAFIFIFNRNMSTAMIVCIIGGGMYFIARKSVRLFLGAIGAALAAAGGYVFVVTHVGAFGFRSTRVLAWLDPAKYADSTSFQTLQGLYGIGSGGWFGKGLGESMQKLGYIPEAQNDMIFSIICEELGVFGALSIILLFGLLCWQFKEIAKSTKDLFGAMVTCGVLIHIASQVVLNIAVVTATIPNTGVTLPFISYGGSSVGILLAEVGIVISISKGRR